MEMTDLLVKISRDLFLEHPITMEAYRTIADFTFLWSVYEGRIFAEEYSNATMRGKVLRGIIRLPDVNIYWEYFTNRYLGDDEQVNATFESLSFGERSWRAEERLRELITKTAPDTYEKTEAIMIIVNRIRNNIFHGIKQVAVYNMQQENVEMSNRVLRDVLISADLHRASER